MGSKVSIYTIIAEEDLFSNEEKNNPIYRER